MSFPQQLSSSSSSSPSQLAKRSQNGTNSPLPISAHVRSLYDAALEMDKELKARLKTEHPDEEKNAQFIDKILANLAQVLTDNFEFASERGAEALIWRVAYRVIEEYRKLLKQYEQLAAKSSGGKAQLKKMESKFLAFLQRITGYYANLIESLSSEHDLEFISRILHDDDVFLGHEEGVRAAHAKHTELQEKVIGCCNRSFVYLGDLARYREQRSDKTPKDFMHAQQFYQKAFRLLPDSGNALNQLAVVAANTGDELSALYYYYRSMMVKNPFPTVKKNLELLFQKNQKAHEEALSTSQSPKNLRKQLARELAFTFGRAYHHEAGVMASAVDQCLETLKLAMDHGQLKENALEQMVVAVFASIFTLKQERQIVVELYRFLAIGIKLIGVRLVRQFELSAAKHFLISLRIFLMHMMAFPKPESRVAQGAAWTEMCESLIDLLNFLNARFPSRSGMEAVSVFEEDEALRGFLPLAAVLDATYFSRKQKSKKPAEIATSRVHSILDLARACSDLQTLPLECHQVDNGWKFSFVSDSMSSPGRKRSPTPLSPSRDHAVPAVVASPLVPASPVKAYPVEEENAAEDDDDEEEVIVFSSQRSSKPTPAPAIQRRASPIGQERRRLSEMSNGSASSVPPTMWSSFANASNPLFGDLMSIAPRQDYPVSGAEIQPSAGHPEMQQMSANLSFLGSDFYANPPMPDTLRYVQSAVEQRRNAPAPPPGFSRPHHVAITPNQEIRYPFGQEAPQAASSAPFQGNPLSWLQPTTQRQGSPTDTSAYFRFPFKMQPPE